MHADEWHIDIPLVRRLLAAQFPKWAELPIERVPSAGTDNAIYRLGEDLAVRLPRRPGATAQVEKEQRWLPKLAPLLPLEIPVPRAMGAPGEGYPWRWSVYPWLAGENVALDRIDVGAFALDLATFIRALRGIDTADAPRAGADNFYRGAPLELRDAPVRRAIDSLRGDLDTEAVTAAWEVALHAPQFDGGPVWIHGDLAPGNLLAQHGRLSAVIDFGCLAAGDPACDVMVAWNALPAHARREFRAALEVDDAAWARGRGWALSMALIALPYYRETNPVIVAASRYVVAEVLADHRRGAA